MDPEDALAQFHKASGLSETALLTLLAPLTQAVVWVGVVWILIAAARAWMAGRSDALETVLLLGRGTVVLVTLVALMALLGST